MNFQPQLQTPLDSMNYGFQKMHMQNLANGEAGIGAQQVAANGNEANAGPTVNRPIDRFPLSRTSSLLDSIGVSRTSSPLVAQVQPLHQPQTHQNLRQQAQHGHHPQAYDYGVSNGGNMQFPSVMNGWGGNVPHAMTADSSGASSPFVSNVHIASNDQAALLAGRGSATPLRAQSATNLYSSQVHSQMGIQQPFPFISPQESHWNYLDVAGNIQGPFPSSQMNQWFKSGYFSHTLQVFRTDLTPEPYGINSRFIPLSDLIKYSNDLSNPFITFDRLVFSSGSVSGMPPGMANVMPNTPLQGSQINLAASMKTETFVEEAPIDLSFYKSTLEEGKDYSYEEILNLKTTDNGHYESKVTEVPVTVMQKSYNNISVTTAVSEASTSASRGKKSEVTTDAKVGIQDTPIVEQFTVSHQDIKPSSSKKFQTQFEAPNEFQLVSTETSSDIFGPEQATKAVTPLIPDVSSQSSTTTKSPSVAKTAPWSNKTIPVEPVNIAGIEELKKRTSSKKQEDQKRLAEMLKQKPVNSDGPIEPISMIHPTSNLAPWANKVTKIEPVILPPMEELKKRPSSKKRPDDVDLLSMKVEEQLIAEHRKEKEVKSVLTWAGKSSLPPVSVNIQPAPKKKSVADLTNISVSNGSNSKLNNLQFDAAPTNASADSSLNEFESSDFIQEQKKLWEEAQRNARNGRTAATESSGEISEFWTVVKSKTAKTKPVQPKIVSQSTSYISPDQLRAIGGTPTSSQFKTKQIGSSTSIPFIKAKASSVTSKSSTSIGFSSSENQPLYPGNASISRRQQFIKWAKSNMKLDAGVQTNPVLEVLFSLPAGKESLEIIADTIYSNSSTMDGKRFAAEFIKRRIECESQLTDPLSWIEALTLPEGDDEDWEFQVVSKKKGRKH